MRAFGRVDLLSNPRARVGRDGSEASIVAGDDVSIHAPAWGATGAGGANHRYHIDWTGDQVWRNEAPNSCDIHFQEGPIKDCGVNGVTQEALLAIVIDRLRSFQTGPFKCIENELALQKCEDALWQLQERTRARIARQQQVEAE